MLRHASISSVSGLLSNLRSHGTYMLYLLLVHILIKLIALICYCIFSNQLFFGRFITSTEVLYSTSLF